MRDRARQFESDIERGRESTHGNASAFRNSYVDTFHKLFLVMHILVV